MEENKKYRIYKVIMLMVLAVFITFIVTTIAMYQFFTSDSFGNKYSLISNSNEKELVSKLEKYKKIIDKYYLGEVNEEELKEGAIKGYIEGLGDPYTEYISKEEMEEYMEDTTGNYVGIGIYMVKDTNTNQIMVLSPIKNSPAQKAGILPEDYIIAVNGESCTADDFSIISNKIKGEEGSKVKIKIQRDGVEQELEITRENIKVNPVEGEVLENNIGYIEFTSFDEGTAEEFKNKYEELKEKGIKSLIIDLRNNGGGIVDEALQIAEYIVPKASVLLYEVDKNNNETVEKSESDPIINIPVVILTNENTASSSEILAGALKDLGKAKIVGTKTYGKGVIQEILSLSDGSGLKITTEEYLTPNKTKLNKIGIEPDVTVELPETVENILQVDRKDDTQLQKAIELCK